MSPFGSSFFEQSVRDDFSNAMSSQDEAPYFGDDGHLDLLGGGPLEEAFVLEEGSVQESICGVSEELDVPPHGDRKRPSGEHAKPKWGWHK